jgi:hypothetical protein
MALRELARLGGDGRSPTMLCRRDALHVRTTQVIEDRVRTVEAIAREALFEAQRTVGTSQLDVMLARDVADLHAIEHG